MPRKFPSLQSLFFPVALFVILANAAAFLKETYQDRQNRKMAFYYFSGIKFSGLEAMFRDIPFAGYVTDKDLSQKQNAAQFSQAQYVLAPTILDLNNTAHEFTFFDYTNKEKAMVKIKDIGAVPIKQNAFGIILARKAQ